MINKKQIHLFFLTICIFHSLYSMEISKQFISDEIIPAVAACATGTGIGAAYGLIHNTVIKKYPQHFPDHARLNVGICAGIGALLATPVIAASRIGSWPQLHLSALSKSLCLHMGIKAVGHYLFFKQFFTAKEASEHGNNTFFFNGIPAVSPPDQHNDFRDTNRQFTQKTLSYYALQGAIFSVIGLSVQALYKRWRMS